MEPLTIPDWLVAFVGRQAILAEAQRVQDAAIIAALRADVQRLQPPVPVAEPNGSVREEVGALEG